VTAALLESGNHPWPVRVNRRLPGELADAAEPSRQTARGAFDRYITEPSGIYLPEEHSYNSSGRQARNALRVRLKDLWRLHALARPDPDQAAPDNTTIGAHACAGTTRQLALQQRTHIGGGQRNPPRLDTGCVKERGDRGSWSHRIRGL
jgi:hypothetical protein